MYSINENAKMQSFATLLLYVNITFPFENFERYNSILSHRICNNFAFIVKKYIYNNFVTIFNPSPYAFHMQSHSLELISEK